LDVLQRIRQAPARPVVRAGERCELCGDPLADEHGHLVDLRARNLLCACRGCALLFTSEGAGGDHFRAVPDRYLALVDFALSPGRWDDLQIPVSVAFFFVNSELGRVAAFYPGPAGATESILPLATWDDVVASNPVLSTMQPDTEALLVRADPARRHMACWLVPIDACYELVGQLRRLWRGFDGGQQARQALEAFFARVDEKAR
jgi:hypothetical protein